VAGQQPPTTREIELKTCSWLAALAAALFASAAVAADSGEEALKRNAVERVVGAHDTALSIKIGRVYVKQAALLEARDLLYRKGRDAGLGREAWNLDSPDWQQAERLLVDGTDALIVRQVADPAWLEQAWSGLVSETLNAEEADEIAVHFRTEGGGLQRRVIEWFVGELTLQYYTFTDRLKYGVPGSEQEMLDLHRVTDAIQNQFEPIYDLTEYPDTMRFASRDPGVKYMKMMVMQGVHVIHTHLEAVADQARATIRARAALADPYVERARAAGGAAGQ
jgi:hypothetical protein